MGWNEMQAAVDKAKYKLVGSARRQAIAFRAAQNIAGAEALEAFAQEIYDTLPKNLLRYRHLLALDSIWLEQLCANISRNELAMVFATPEWDEFKEVCRHGMAKGAFRLLEEEISYLHPNPEDIAEARRHLFAEFNRMFSVSNFTCS